MKLHVFLLALLLATTATAQSTHRALFLGNSYTYVNDLPSIVQSLTLAGGDTLIQDSYAPGGYTFEGHSTDLNSLGKISAQPWDFVILQEQSQRPSFPQSQVQTDVYPYAAILDDSIDANDSCTVTVFYMTWGRKYGDASNCGFWPPVCTYAGMQYELRRSYLNMASQNAALVAPCGSAWWESIQRDSTLELYHPDESHPSYAGSYLNGCVFYATLYRRSPIGLDFYGLLDTTTAQFLQQVAHDVVFDSLALWRIGLDDVSASWTYTADTQGNAAFTNTSSNGLSYYWDFGDGNTSSASDPTHTYQQAGVYTVSLIATDGCTTDTTSDLVEIILVGRAAPSEAALTVTPNPNDGRFTVRGMVDGATDVRVYDLQGRLVHATPMAADGDLSLVIDLRHLQKGMYLLRMGEGATQRILIH